MSFDVEADLVDAFDPCASRAASALAVLSRKQNGPPFGCNIPAALERKRVREDFLDRFTKNDNPFDLHFYYRPRTFRESVVVPSVKTGSRSTTKDIERAIAEQRIDPIALATIHPGEIQRSPMNKILPYTCDGDIFSRQACFCSDDTKSITITGSDETRISACVERLKFLQKISIHDAPLHVIENIGGSRWLMTVDIDATNTNITRFSGLDQAPLIFDLKVTGTNVDKHGTLIEPISPIKKIGGVDALGKLPELNYLQVTNVAIGKTDFLANLDKLKKLNLGICNLKKIENLESLTKLEELKLSGNEITTIEGLNKIKKVKHIDLSKNQIEKIEGLKRLHKLEGLNLSSNQIEKIDGLDGLDALGSLVLEDNQISKIEGLDNVPNLDFLILDHNNIKKIKGLGNLPKLYYLSMNDNKIRKIEGLATLTKLQTLALGGNPISKLDGLDGLDALKDVWLVNTKLDMEDCKEFEKTHEKMHLTCWKDSRWK